MVRAEAHREGGRIVTRCPCALAGLILLAACGRSEATRQREVTACSSATGSAGAYGTSTSNAIWGCLMLTYGWDQLEALRAALNASGANRAVAERAAAALTRPAPAGTHWCHKPGDTAWTTCPN